MIALLLKKSKKKTKSLKIKFLPAKVRVKRRRMKTLPPNILMAMITTFDMKIMSLLLKNQRIQKIIMPIR